MNLMSFERSKLIEVGRGPQYLVALINMASTRFGLLLDVVGHEKKIGVTWKDTSPCWTKS